MNFNPQIFLRSHIVIALAAIVLLCGLVGWAGFFGANDPLSWPTGVSAEFIAAHAAHARAELEKIHRGVVDQATLTRIADAASSPSNSEAGSDRGVDDADRGALAQDVAQYLADHGTAAGTAMTKIGLVAMGGHDIDAGGSDAAPPPAEPVAPPDNRTFVGEKVCETCHQQEAQNWAHTIHAAVFTLNPRNADEAEGCEACHGPGSAHVKNPGDLSTIISFSHKSQTPIAQQNARCLSCHKGGERIFWAGSVHENNNLACSDCHNPMANFSAHGLTARESISQTCFSCHKVQRAEFNERSHMPLLEGKISCVDCHNPHGSTTAPLLKADSVNEVCYGCHADKRGPFLFEHAPVRESCLNCHNPHGSNFESLLNAPRPMLCQQCHEQNGHPAELLTMGNLAGGLRPDPRLIATSCQTCHVNIHGSNDPSGERFER